MSKEKEIAVEAMSRRKKKDKEEDEEDIDDKDDNLRAEAWGKLAKQQLWKKDERMDKRSNIKKPFFKPAYI